jgi:CHAT domain-containing protein/tetratricopeptide (TPR) repeat protein
MRLHFVALFLGGIFALGAQAPDPPLLTAGVSVTDTLAEGQTRVYQIALEPGDFVVVSIGKTPYLPVLEVLEPGGAGQPKSNWPDPSFLATTAGRYRVRLSPNPVSIPPGPFQITAAVHHPATPADKLRADADRMFGEIRTRYTEGARAAVQAAVDQSAKALDLFRQAGYQPGEIRVLMLRGLACIDLNDQSSARADLNLAIQLAHAAGDDWSEARLLQYVGSSYRVSSDWEAALRSAEQSLRLFERLGDLDNQSGVLNNIARIYSDQGDNRTALENYDRALAFSLSAGDRDSAATIYVNRGTVLTNLGRLPDALESLNSAAPLIKAVGGMATLDLTRLNNTGIAYKQLGDYHKALDAYQQALTGYRRLGNASAEGQLLNNIGNVHQLLEDYPASLDYYGQALAIARRINQRGLEMTALNNIGTTFQKQGEYARALEQHQQVLKMRREAGDQSGEASALNQSGIDWYKQGALDKASDALHAALELRRRLGEQGNEADTLLNLAAVERDRGDPATARATIEAALKETEAVRSRITDANLRASYIARVEDTYASYVDILMQQHLQAPAAGHDQAALAAAEHSRARVLLESLAEARANLREDVSADVLAAERSASRALDAASARLSKLLTQRSSEADVAAAQKALDAADAAYQDARTRIRVASPRYAALTQPASLSVPQIQREVIDDNTVLLEFALGERRSWLWAVTRGAVTSVALPSGREIAEAARALNREVTTRQRKPGESAADYTGRIAAADRQLPVRAAALGRMLFGGIASQLAGPWRDKRLAIVASGALEYVPFAALPVPAAAGTGAGAPLIAGHEIVEIPSASVLATLRHEMADRPAPRHTLAILADPVFEIADPRVAAKVQPAAQAPDVDLPYAAERIDEVRGGPLTRLPFSREEAAAIAAIANRPDTLTAMDFNASRTTALSGSLAGYRIVHFATHGLIDTEHPDLSGLVLSLVNDRGVVQDGFLRLTDIYNLRLQADLVVLSACQTALGKEIRGEGLVGLTRGFMYAGTPRVVASLWEVNDLATAELMKKFYAGLLQQKLRPAAALRAAQRQMAQEPRWSSPYFWAGFVLQGDWN